MPSLMLIHSVQHVEMAPACIIQGLSATEGSISPRYRGLSRRLRPRLIARCSDAEETKVTMRNVGLLRWVSVGFLVAEASALAGCEKRPDTCAAAAASVSVAPPPPAEPPRLEITLASGQNHPFSVVVDKGYVYWVNDDLDTDSGTVLRVAINGGTPTVIASSQYELSDGGRIAVYGGNVYW